jgi:dihydropteroate synthase
MGILNVTPDSFSDGGRAFSLESALVAAERLVAEGADIIDIGGESTRPGSQRVAVDEQRRRVIPVIEAIRTASGRLASIPISIDTTRAAVAHDAIAAGAHAINDVSGGTEDPAMLQTCATARAGLVLMHRLAPPDRDRYSDQYAKPPEYGDVCAAVRQAFERDLLPRAYAAGIEPGQVVVDPGLGFGKSVDDNLHLLNDAAALNAATGRPVLSGLSLKSFVGRVSLGRDSTPQERQVGTLALSVLHLERGARIFRVHGVRAHREAIDAAWHTITSRTHHR